VTETAEMLAVPRYDSCARGERDRRGRRERRRN